jgi:hypothetical protein
MKRYSLSELLVLRAKLMIQSGEALHLLKGTNNDFLVGKLLEWQTLRDQAILPKQKESVGKLRHELEHQVIRADISISELAYNFMKYIDLLGRVNHQLRKVLFNTHAKDLSTAGRALLCGARGWQDNLDKKALIGYPVERLEPFKKEATIHDLSSFEEYIKVRQSLRGEKHGIEPLAQSPATKEGTPRTPASYERLVAPPAKRRSTQAGSNRGNTPGNA